MEDGHAGVRFLFAKHENVYRKSGLHKMHK